MKGNHRQKQNLPQKAGNKHRISFQGKQIVYNNRTYMVGLGLDLSDIKKSGKGIARN
jgi:hypothetical protein